MEHGEQDRLRLVDLWIFQKREIEEARLQSGEDDRLETEKRVLANAEKIYNAAMNAFDLLYEGNGSTASSLRAAQKQVEELVRYEPKFQEALAALETARISVEDVGATRARLCGRDSCLAGTSGAGGGSAGAARPAETKVWADA